MNGLDTNVLIRYFTQDDSKQSLVAEQCILTACTEKMNSALKSYQVGQGDFADAVIGRDNRSAGCETTYTFDRKAARLAEFTLL